MDHVQGFPTDFLFGFCQITYHVGYITSMGGKMGCLLKEVIIDFLLCRALLSILDILQMSHSFFF